MLFTNSLCNYSLDLAPSFWSMCPAEHPVATLGSVLTKSYRTALFVIDPKHPSSLSSCLAFPSHRFSWLWKYVGVPFGLRWKDLISFQDPWRRFGLLFENGSSPSFLLVAATTSPMNSMMYRTLFSLSFWFAWFPWKCFHTQQDAAMCQFFYVFNRWSYGTGLPSSLQLHVSGGYNTSICAPHEVSSVQLFGLLLHNQRKFRMLISSSENLSVIVRAYGVSLFQNPDLRTLLQSKKFAINLFFVASFERFLQNGTFGPVIRNYSQQFSICRLFSLWREQL